MKKDPWSARKNLFTPYVPVQVKKQKLRYKWGKIFWGALKKTCGVLGALVLFSALLTMCAISPAIKDQAEALPSDMVLVMKLDGGLGDLPIEEGFVDAFNENPVTLKSYIDAIYAAKGDPRVKGIYAQYTGGGYALSQVQELRVALNDFRSAGKFTYVYAPSYGGGLGAYYLISAFDEIWMQPMGTLSIGGVNAEIPFFREVLDRVGIEPQFFQRKEYKSAYESFTNAGISKANKEATEKLIEDLTGQLTQDISIARDITESKFKSLVDHGLFIDKRAHEAGLIDVLDYEDALRDKIKERVGGSVAAEEYDGYVPFERYHHSVLQKKQNKKVVGKPKVALIYVVGAIVGSREGAKAPSGFVDDGYAEGPEIAQALLDAAKDDTVEAVVLRVDSPGGSPVASETILHAVQKVRDAGKPVIVSMGSAAASGGYWVSAYADYIFAMPTTITGSIGVLGGKISTAQMWDMIGVNWHQIKWGENAAMWSMNSPFSKSEAERMDAMLDNIYDSFIERVAKGRKMSVENIEEIARGRVWSGQSALQVGLVDAHGGMNDALDYAATQIGKAGRDEVAVQIMPKPLTPVERLVEMLEGQVMAGQMIGLQADLVSYLRPVLSQLHLVRQVAPHGAAVYEPLSVE